MKPCNAALLVSGATFVAPLLVCLSLMPSTISLPAPRRHVVCCNPEQAVKDAATRAELLVALEGKLRSGAKSLIANKGFRRHLSMPK